ncbi:MAG: 30S ribosomal protein S2 [Parcubacteria group bacterium CG10_big_fil_rev_8_21_14_0_10_38_31]|nr:MAG: 30S ribosomal protein S2 [Parcubacteria group bacterium CG10_big_fil_rev_8_21_14_0_10_38_31]
MQNTDTTTVDTTTVDTKDEAEETLLSSGDDAEVKEAKPTADMGEIDSMFKAGVHYGYSRRSRHPKTRPYIFTTKNNVEIFDLEKVDGKIKEVEEFVKGLAKEGKVVLFVGTKPEAKEAVLETAKDINMPFCIERWLGGTFTNFSNIRKRMDYFEGLKETKTTDKWLKYTKKERSEFDKDIEKMERFFGGLVSLKKKPDAVVIIDAKYEEVAKDEALKSAVPVISLINSDNNPTGIDYPVVGNDATRSSIKYFLDRIGKAYKAGATMKVTDVPKVEKVEDEKELTKSE